MGRKREYADDAERARAWRQNRDATIRRLEAENRKLRLAVAKLNAGVAATKTSRKRKSNRRKKPG